MIITERRASGKASLYRAGSIAVAIVLSPCMARAGDGRLDEAEALFQRARELMGHNDFATACPLLERAYSLDDGAGTLLALALCHEGNGKPATALREYRESLSLAVRANRSDRVMLAESHAQRLEATVPRLTLRFASTPPPELALELDRAAVDRATMSTGAAVDPGAHEIVARNRTTVLWRTTVVVTAASGTLVVDVPVLASVAVAHEGPAPSSGSRILGWTAVGAGVVAASVGAAFGIAAFDAEARSKQECTGNQCSADGVALNHQSRQDALASDVSFGVGVAALAGGIFLLLRSSASASSASTAAWLRPWFGEGRAGVGLAISW
jgi:hypothetical protein